MSSTGWGGLRVKDSGKSVKFRALYPLAFFLCRLLLASTGKGPAVLDFRTVRPIWTTDSRLKCYESEKGFSRLMLV